MKNCFLIAVMTLFLTSAQIKEAQDIIINGIADNDPKKNEKISLVIRYLDYSADKADIKAVQQSRDFLENFDLNVMQKADVHIAVKKVAMSFINNTEVEFNEKEFVERSEKLFETSFGCDAYTLTVREGNKVNADVVAFIWFRYILKQFNGINFQSGDAPGIGRALADEITSPNGLLSYMLHKAKTNSDVKGEYLLSAMVLSNIISSDARKFAHNEYRGFEMPKLCSELRMLAEIEEERLGTTLRFALFKDFVDKDIFKIKPY